MYYSKYSGEFNCEQRIRSKNFSAPQAHINDCINVVKDKNELRACMYWFRRCMCCKWGDCNALQKLKGMGKGKCNPYHDNDTTSSTASTSSIIEETTSEGFDIMSFLSEYGLYIAIGIGALILLKRR